jgi:anti-sigma factor RsiW
MDSDQEKQMVQYLLGQLSEQEQVELERQYLMDDALFEELLAIEEELRDTYVRGELSKADRQAFEQRLLILPHQKEKQEFARTLRQYLAQEGTPAGPLAHVVAKWKSLLRILGAQPRTVLIPALSMTLVVLVGGSGLLVRRSMQSSRYAPATASTASRLPGQAPQPQPQTSIPAPEQEAGTVTFLLTPGLIRGGVEESRPLVIPAGVGRVRLEARVDVDGDYSNYEAVLQTAENKRIWSEGNLNAQTFPAGKRVFIVLSGSLLPPGDYILTLSGLTAAGRPESVAEYAFRVAKR